MKSNKSDHQAERLNFPQFINYLRTQFSSKTCVFEEFNFWPVLVFAINYKRKMGKTYVSQEVPEIDERELFKGPFQQFLYRLKIWNPNWGNPIDWRDRAAAGYSHDHFEDLKKSDVLYLNRKTQYHRSSHGIIFHPQNDSLRYISSNTALECTLVDKDPREEGEEFLVPTSFLPAVMSFKPVQLVFPRDIKEFSARQKIIKNVSRLNSVIRRGGVDLEINIYDVLLRVEIVSRHIVFYTLLLKKIQPRIIYISSFTGAYYVCIAAKKLGITVVDIQHGGMNQGHFMTADWRNELEHGYEIMPEYFWCWNERSARYIETNSQAKFKAIIGGNPLRALQEKLAEQEGSALPAAKYSPDQGAILVALQYGKEPLIPPHILEAYLATKSNVNWVFRLHPMGMDRLEEAKNLLGISKKDLVKNSEALLFSQLNQVDVVITGASTIVFEATELGLPAAVWSTYGASLFEDLIEAGEINYLSNKQEAIRWIDQKIGAFESGYASQSANRPPKINVEEQSNRAFSYLLELSS